MNTHKIIFHVDVNSAFLSWTAVKKLKEDPNALDLRTVPSVICGDVETRHGIVTAKSIPAKKYGIKTAEPVMSAIRKCPNLILEKSDFATYKKYSRSFMAILRSYSDYVEQASIDEAYVDMTEAIGRYCSQENVTEEPIISLADKIKNEIHEKLGFTVNIGISVNKLLAKTASDFTKPDRVHTLWPEEIQDKMWPMDIGDLFGCGGATSSRLKSLGIMTIGDVAHEDPKVLQSYLGNKTGEYIWRSANGIGSDRVHVESEDAKSYSNETTLSHDIDAELFDVEAPQIVRELAESVSGRMKRDGIFAQTVGIMVKTSDFKRLSRQVTLDTSTNDAAVIFESSYQLLRRLVFGSIGTSKAGTNDPKVATERVSNTEVAIGALSSEEYRVQQAAPGSLFASGGTIRLIGVSAAKLDHGEYRQVSLFDYLEACDTEEEEQTICEEEAEQPEISNCTSKCIEMKTRSDERRERLDQMLGNIRGRYGEDAVTTGTKLLTNTEN